ncbi:MAG TPA: glycogen synthase GlgA [candidate division Zixibacteria bacterium]|nr:glycogen synthase GlgA [candidate division Zixibacteria bacterium]
MKILLAGSEMAPLVKTGGLGDVLGALPKALAELGNEVAVCIPSYSKDIEKKFSGQRVAAEGVVNIGGDNKSYQIYETEIPQTPFKTFLIKNEEYFGRHGLYVDPKTGKNFEDNDLRFSFFCKVIIDFLQKINWRPDIVHAHDWQAALLPVYIRVTEKENQFFSKTKTVLTIHNMAYQGKFPKSRYHLLKLPEELHYATAPLEYFGETNFLKGGISFADKVTTVSETYAREIQGPLGSGLEGVLKQRAKDVVGILNGVDYSVWSPEKDRLIPYRFRTGNMSGKKKDKIELLKTFGWPVAEGVPLVGMVSRLVEQKGLNLIIEGAKKIFALDLQLVILGSGDKKIERELKWLETEYPNKMKVFLKFDEKLAHQIEAGADMYLMPSLFEPCGLNQMYSLKYGTPPIVHKTGGLVDTVADHDLKTDTGTGLVFEKFTVDSMVDAISRAVELYSKKRKWSRLVKNGMSQDFSWNSSAKKYHNLFESLVKN